MQWAKEKFREELAGRLTAQVCQRKKPSDVFELHGLIYSIIELSLNIHLGNRTARCRNH